MPASVHAQQRPRLGTRGPLTQSDLSRELELGHSTVSGIVQRQPSSTDRRYTRISLTDELSHTAPPLIAHGPRSRLVAALATARAQERHTMREGLTLLQRYLTSWSDSAES